MGEGILLAPPRCPTLPLVQVAVNNEVLLAVSNSNLAGPGGMLETWVANVRLAGMRNALVVALDDPTKEAMDRLSFPAHRMDVQVRSSKRLCVCVGVGEQASSVFQHAAWGRIAAPACRGCEWTGHSAAGAFGRGWPVLWGNKWT